MDVIDQAHAAVSPQPPEGVPVPGAPDAVKVQILATEHWSLLASRTNIWNEMFTRTGMFLTVVSSSVVALSLISQATDFSNEFRILSILVLPIVLLVGLGTFLRVSAANNEDIELIIGMNRLRRAYLEIAPELEQYFITGSHDDYPGIVRTYGLNAQRPTMRVLSSTMLLVGLVDAVVAGVFVALLLQQLFAVTDQFVVAVGCVVSIVMGILLCMVPIREIRRFRVTHGPKFPSS